MSKSTTFIILLLILFGCSKKQPNEKLLAFQSTFLTEENGSDEYRKIEKLLKSKIKVDYINDIIVASKIVETNSCGKYSGDLDIRQDTIVLVYKLSSNEICGSGALDRFTYIISNPENKKYEFFIRKE